MSCASNLIRIESVTIASVADPVDPNPKCNLALVDPEAVSRALAAVTAASLDPPAILAEIPPVEIIPVNELPDPANVVTSLPTAAGVDEETVAGSLRSSTTSHPCGN